MPVLDTNIVICIELYFSYILHTSTNIPCANDFHTKKYKNKNLFEHQVKLSKDIVLCYRKGENGESDIQKRWKVDYYGVVEGITFKKILRDRTTYIN